MIITVTNNKGGVGKTTITNELLSLFSREGARALGVDLDSQGNLTIMSGVQVKPDVNIYSVLKGDVPAGQAVYSGGYYDIIPSSKALSNADSGEFAGSAGSFHMLREALGEISDLYGVIIIDTAPSVGLLVQNALTASDYVLIPVEADVFSFQGLATVANMISDVRKYTNHSLQALGCVLSRFTRGRAVEKYISETAIPDLLRDVKTRLKLDIPLFAASVRSSTKAKESQTFHEPMTVKFPKEGVSGDMLELFEEIKWRIGAAYEQKEPV